MGPSDQDLFDEMVKEEMEKLENELRQKVDSEMNDDDYGTYEPGNTFATHFYFHHFVCFRRKWI